MNHVIDRVYTKKTVVGESGTCHQLHSEIDRREGEFILNIIKENIEIKNTLEVGCAYGLSSMFICLGTKGRSGAHHTIIDPFQETDWDNVGLKHLKESNFDHFKLIEKKSEFALPRLLEDMEGKFDFIFIDGNHTFDHTLIDCFYSSRLLRVGGYLVIDDVCFPSIKRVVDYFLNYPCYEKYGSVSKKKRAKLKTKIIRKIMSPIPKKTWQKYLQPIKYRKIFADQVDRMVALRKIKEDNRNWDWHDDRF